MLLIILTIIGLCLFEIITSVDNAVINADVLRTMSARARRWFLIYGIFAAVFLIRGLLPLLILWMSNPGLGIKGTLFASLSVSRQTQEFIEITKPILLIGGGVFLLFVFLHWLFDERKEYAFFLEKFIHRHSIWFYSFVSVILMVLVWLAIKVNPFMALSAVVGSTAFFIVSGFKKNAELKEKELASPTVSDISKILYLELIDASFSVDGVLGAFAFTLVIPLIMLGNGLGAFVVRELTIRGLETVKKYRYLKNGAMYSIGVLGIVMLFESFGREIPQWFPPIITIAIIGFFFWLSRKALRIALQPSNN